jgi:ATP-binding cassette, subfamily B, multidrug efflux pump
VSALGARVERVRPALEDIKGPEKQYDLALLRRLYPFAKPHRRLFIAALVLTPITAAAGLVQPYLMKRAVDAAIVVHDASLLGKVTAAFAVAIGVDFVARFIQMYTLQLGGQRTVAELRARTYDKVQRLPLSYLDKTPVGRVVTRVTNDSDAIGELFASGAVLAIADVLTLVGIVAWLLWLDPILSLVVFAALPFLALAVNAIRTRMRVAFRAIRATIAQLNGYVAEQVQGIAIVQAFGREADCLAEYEQINAAHRDANYQSIRYDALLYSIVESVSAITIALVLWYAAVRLGGLPAERSAAYVGVVIAFYEYIQRFFVPIRDLSQKYTILQSSLAAAERVFALLDLREEDAPEGMTPSASPQVAADAALALRGVDFGYRVTQPILQGVDLTVNVGQTVAIVGATGAGKTTITALLLRLYDVQSGSVLVDGCDVRSYDRDALRAKFSCVPQDVFLFAGTALENVTAFADDPSRDRAEEALSRVGAWEMLKERGGLNARVDESVSSSRLRARSIWIAHTSFWTRRPPTWTPRPKQNSRRRPRRSCEVERPW